MRTSSPFTALLALLTVGSLPAQAAEVPPTNVPATVRHVESTAREVGTAAREVGTAASQPRDATQQRLAQAQAITTGSGSAGLYTDRLSAILRRGSSPSPSLVIPGSDKSPQDQADLQEDLAVMAHLLNKALDERLGGQSAQRRVMGVDVFFVPGSSSFRNLYLDGYGALFLLDVAFPLIAPAATPETKEEAKDTAWQQAREELYGAAEDRSSARAGEEFSEQKVNTLKETLLEALKNASNLRLVKADEYITVCVFGAGTSSAPKNRVAGHRPVPEHRDLLLGPEYSRGSGRGTMLTIRVKKSDTEAFAKGKLDLDQFRKQTQITLSANFSTAENPSHGGGFGSSVFGGSSYGAVGSGGAGSGSTGFASGQNALGGNR